MRRAICGLVAGACLGLGAMSLGAQSSTPPTPGQQDNPFPAEQAKPDATKQNASQPRQAKPDAAKQAPAKPAGGNEFPGENSDAPIIPVDPGPGNGAGRSNGREASRSSAGDGDPVRSPDGDSGSDDGFSSSNTGLSPATADDDSPAPTKSTKNKSRKQEIKEDVDVGGFYLEKKNWKAAQERFTTAFALDAENPDAVWGLAEAERHLLLLDKAKEHYELFLSYDPKGPHNKAARKALEQVEEARSSNPGSTKTPSNLPH